MKKLSFSEKMLGLSILFNMVLIGARLWYTKELVYGFYIWNTFLAVLPLFFSRRLVQLERLNYKAMLLLGGWLAFFPNAPYMITDLFHFTSKPPVPLWFDLMLVTSAAWNGLLLGIISLMQVERFLTVHLKPVWAKWVVPASCILCGYGVYIGRFLRFNSWDVLTNPFSLVSTMGHHVFQPRAHIGLWAFTVLFGGLFGIVFFTLKGLRQEASH